jgi:putative oxidoreductase
MKSVNDLDNWGSNNRDVGLLLLRIVLGTVLLLKAFRFLFNISDITNVINSYHPTSMALAFSWIVILANMAGGIFILIGVLTRVVCVVQIPILIGAMLINVETHVLNSSEWMLAFVTFFLIVYLYIYGSGKYSLSYVLLKEPHERPSTDEYYHQHRHNHA